MMIGVKSYFARQAARLTAFCGDRSASAMVLGVLIFPIIILAAGAAVDYGSAQTSYTRMQEMADAASIAAARELVLANADSDQIESVAKLNVAANHAEKPRAVLSAIAVKATSNKQLGTVTVELSAMHKNVFGGFLNPAQSKIVTTSVARALGGTSLCVLGLHKSANGAIRLEDDARMTADNCAVYSNSSHKHAIKTFHNSEITAELICSVGGTDGLKGSMTPSPLTDCPEVDDPLAARPGPTVGSCDETNLVINGMTTTLSPGVYCGGLTIQRASEITFESGVYIMQDGPLNIEDTSEVEGEYVGFYFTGSGAEMTIGQNTSIELSAPKDGDLAGLLFFQDGATAASKSRFRILSNDARVLLGTIYLPEAEFFVDATAPIADQSAYTVVIANRFLLYAGPNLVLNSDYGATDVPVPEGVLSQNATITLVK